MFLLSNHTAVASVCGLSIGREELVCFWKSDAGWLRVRGSACLNRGTGVCSVWISESSSGLTLTHGHTVSPAGRFNTWFLHLDVFIVCLPAAVRRFTKKQANSSANGRLAGSVNVVSVKLKQNWIKNQLLFWITDCFNPVTTNVPCNSRYYRRTVFTAISGSWRLATVS